MNIRSLQPYFSADELEASETAEQLAVFYASFKTDFIDTPYIHKGKEVVVAGYTSKIKLFQEYSSSFHHIVTRMINPAGRRIFDCHRANRVHWIKPILDAHESKQILFYKWRDDDKICKEHYFAIHLDFMVILKENSNSWQLVTAFCVDPDEKKKYYERYIDFRDNDNHECK